MLRNLPQDFYSILVLNVAELTWDVYSILLLHEAELTQDVYPILFLVLHVAELTQDVYPILALEVAELDQLLQGNGDRFVQDSPLKQINVTKTFDVCSVEKCAHKTWINRDQSGSL